jgi:DNA-binding MarR family transcriptional regulator
VPTAPPTDDILAAIASLQRLADLFRLRRAQLAGEAGLTEAQWGVVEEIATEHFMPSMFARGREQSAPAVSRIIRQLLQKGLIAVSVSAADGRQRNYVLTPKGRRVLDGLRDSRRQAIDAVWADLDPRDLKAFARFGATLIERLEAYAGADRARPGRRKAS